VAHDDPFELWTYAYDSSPVAGLSREMNERARELLAELGEELDEARAAGRAPRHDAHWSMIEKFAALPAGDLPRAQELYLRVVEQGGPRNAEVQAALLGLVGRAASPESIPFWRELLAMTIPRDQFSKRRKRYAVAALAWMLARRGEKPALQLVLAGLRAPDAEVRALAAEYLGHALAAAKTKAPKSASIEALTRTATEDPATLPRLTARLALKDAGAPVPIDLPGGAYAFKVWRAHDSKVYRVVELKSEQTFDDLHDAIQSAFDWDADHLYLFWLSGKARDEQYELGHSEVDSVRSYAHSVALGEAGLAKGHTFLYLFDFGDEQLFHVKVVGTRAKAGPGRLPRVVETVGASPPQYPDYG
jgi:hypothetical protein